MTAPTTPALPTRQRLIETAAELFYAQGFQAVGLDAILDAVGITKTAFYKHFESKDALILAVLDHRDRVEVNEWVGFIRARGTGDARASLHALFDLLDEWFSKPAFNGCLFLNALTEFPNESDPINQSARRHGEHIAAAIMALARAAGAKDPEALTEQLMLLVTGAIASRHRGHDLAAAKTAARVALVLVRDACEPAPAQRQARA